MKQKPTVVASPSRDLGIALLEFEGVDGIPNRDAVGYYYKVQRSRDEAPSRVAVLFSGTVFYVNTDAFGLPKVEDQETRFTVFAEAAIGDYLDEHGIPNHTPSGVHAAKIECFSAHFQAWGDRTPASDDEIEAYIAAHLFWSWQFAQDGWELGLADCLRLHQPMKVIQRLVSVGDGKDWKMSPRPPHASWLAPLPAFLREQREARARPNKSKPAANGLAEYQFLLQAVYDHFRKHSAWPPARQLEIDLEDRLDRLGGLEHVCRALGLELIVCGTPYDATSVCRLKVPAFLHCRGAEDDVWAFLEAVRYCAKKYREAKGAQVTVSALEFMLELKLTEDAARRVGLMLYEVGDLWTSASQSAGTLPTFTMGPLMRLMKDVTSLQDFLSIQRRNREGQGTAPLGGVQGTRSSPSPKQYDVFIAYAYEDKEAVAHPLAEVLGKSVVVWYDEFALKVGDSLRRSIDNGLASCRYGVVILSPAFFKKEWPQRELDGLTAREIGGRKVILPVWHRMDFEGVRAVSPTLADRVAAKTREGIDAVATRLLDAIRD